MGSNLVNLGHVLCLERNKAPAVTWIQLFNQLRDIFFLRAEFCKVNRHADGMQEAAEGPDALEGGGLRVLEIHLTAEHARRHLSKAHHVVVHHVFHPGGHDDR